MKPSRQHYSTEPLTHDERNYLQLIYNNRLRIFAPVFLLLIFTAICFAVSHAGSNHDKDPLPPVEQAAVNFLFLGGPIMLAAVIIFRRRINCYRIDIKNGLKEMVPFEILEKEYFPYTGQYYFRIDDPDNMHFEVDEEMYASYSKGDLIYIARAPRSKQTFEHGGRFSLM